MTMPLRKRERLPAGNASLLAVGALGSTSLVSSASRSGRQINSAKFSQVQPSSFPTAGLVRPRPRAPETRPVASGRRRNGSDPQPADAASLHGMAAPPILGACPDGGSPRGPADGGGAARAPDCKVAWRGFERPWREYHRCRVRFFWASTKSSGRSTVSPRLPTGIRRTTSNGSPVTTGARSGCASHSRLRGFPGTRSMSPSRKASS